MSDQVDFYIWRNDTSPALLVVAKDDNENVIDISGSSVQFKMWDENGALLVDSSGTVVDGVNGEMKYEWASRDTDYPQGIYDGQFKVTFSGGELESFPNTRTIKIKIMEQ